MGHYLDLEHTHRSSPIEAGFAMLVTKCYKEAIDRDRTWPTFNLCFGNRIKSSIICESTGDALSDTPADPDLQDNRSPNCTYFNLHHDFDGRHDPWGDAYTDFRFPSPLVDNLMSYTSVYTATCRTHFTRMQIGVMLHYLNNNSLGTESRNYNYTYDDYEPDNSWEYAQFPGNKINFGETQERSFHRNLNALVFSTPFIADCDEDWVTFTPTCTRSLTINTFEVYHHLRANTRLTLFDDDHTTILAQNDDVSGSDQFSSVTYNFITNHTYFIRIDNMSPGVASFYSLNIGGNYYGVQIDGPPGVCNTGSSTYTIDNLNELTSGTQVAWSFSPTNYTNASCIVCPATTLTMISANQELTITAVINHACLTSPITITKDICTGAPPANPALNFGWQLSPNNTPTTWRYEGLPIPGGVYSWYNCLGCPSLSTPSTGATTNLVKGTPTNIFDIFVPCKTQYSICYKITNYCGMSNFSNTLVSGIGYCKPVRQINNTYLFDHPIKVRGRTALPIQVASNTQEWFGHLFYSKRDLAEERIKAVNIYNKQGDLKLQFADIDARQAEIDIEELPAGTYNVEVIGEGEFKEMHTFYYSELSQEGYLLDDVASGSLTINGDRAADRLYVLQQKLFTDLQADEGAMEASEILKEFARNNANTSLGIIYQIQAALAQDDIIRATRFLDEWETQNVVDANFKKFYSYYIKVFDDKELSTKELSNLNELAQQCPLTDGEIVYTARDLYKYLVPETVENYNYACGNIGLRSSTPPQTHYTVVSHANTIYPNPAKGNFTITNLAYGNKNIAVINMFGKVLQQTSTKNQTMPLQLQVPAGIYILQITNTTTGKVDTKKLIIE